MAFALVSDQSIAILLHGEELPVLHRTTIIVWQAFDTVILPIFDEAVSRLIHASRRCFALNLQIMAFMITRLSDGMLVVTYLTRYGFFNTECRIVASAVSGQGHLVTYQLPLFLYQRVNCGSCEEAG